MFRTLHRLSTETKPLLVMEYLPLGNLEDQHAEDLIAVEETTVHMYQSLNITFEPNTGEQPV